MRVDLKTIEQSLTNEEIINLVQELGADRYEEKNEYIIFPTICHNIDSSEAQMKLYYYKKNKKFHCYTGCGDNFNIFELFKRRYELLNLKYDFYNDIVLKIAGDKSLFKLSEGFGVKYQSIRDRYEKQHVDVDIKPISKSLLNVFTFNPTWEWINDGISVETMRTFNILYYDRQNKIVIPHYDMDNNLIGIRGRALNEEDLVYGKYMPIQIEGQMYSHPLGYNLYGLNMNKDNIKLASTAIVFEGEKSVLQYETMYGRNKNITVAVCGSSLSLYQVKLLSRAGARKIVVAFDSPADPITEIIEHYKKTEKICSKYKNIITIGFIADHKRILKPKCSPTDQGKEVFEELMKHVVWLK